MSEAAFRLPHKINEKEEISRILERPEVLIAAEQNKCVEMRASIIDARDFSLLPGLVLREIIIEHAGSLSPAELKAAFLYIKQLERVMGFDELTQVWNRKMLNHDLARIWNRAKHTGEHAPHTVLAVVDIDHFKQVNSLGGLPAGDEVLKQLARLMKTVFRRATDRVYRYGGEEFVIVMEDTTEERAQNLLETVRQLVEQELLKSALQNIPDPHTKTQLATREKVTISVGYVERGNQSNPREWFAQADAALYAAKNGVDAPVSRNQVRLFHSGFKKPSVEIENNSPRPTNIGEIIAEHLPPIEQSNQEIHEQYLAQGALLAGQQHTPVHTDPRRGMESILCHIAQQVGAEKAYATDMFQVAEAAIQYIERHAYLDALTQLPNVAAFRADVQRVWSEMTREGKSHTLVIFDIDKFKLINDNFGHDIGDLVLRAAARVLKTVSREGESVARIGGEEFALLVEVDGEHVSSIVERLRAQFESDVMTEVQRMCTAQDLNVQFDRVAFTITLGVQMITPVARSIEDTYIYTVPSFDQVKQGASRALNIGKGIDSRDPQSLGLRTSRPGVEGRNRWVITE